MADHAAPDAPTHAQRLRPMQPECRFRIAPDALLWSDAQGQPLGRVPFADITELRLRFAPSRFAHHRFEAVLRVHDGPAVRIVNQTYAGLANYEDRSASYTPFVLALRQALLRANPALPVHAGVAPARWALDAVLAAVSAALLAGVVLRSVQHGPWWLALLSVALVAGALRWVGGHLWRNRPQRLAPGQEIPALVLPRR